MVRENLGAKKIETIYNLGVYKMCSKTNKNKTHLNLSLMQRTNDYFLFMDYKEFNPKEHREKIKEFIDVSKEKYFYVKIPKEIDYDAVVKDFMYSKDINKKIQSDYRFQIKNSFLSKSIQRISL